MWARQPGCAGWQALHSITHHVHCGVSSKVVDAAAGEEDVGLVDRGLHLAEGAQPAKGGPDPVGDDGVDKQHDGQLVQLQGGGGGGSGLGGGGGGP